MMATNPKSGSWFQFGIVGPSKQHLGKIIEHELNFVSSDMNRFISFIHGALSFHYQVMAWGYERSRVTGLITHHHRKFSPLSQGSASPGSLY
jgi:hypothetical protein